MQKGFSLKKRFLLHTYRGFIRNEARIHELRYLFWECTLRCSLNCLHCGSDCLQDSHTPDMPREVFLEQMHRLAHRVTPSKINVVFTGGEPLLRKDLEETGTALRRLGYRWGMVSNGMIYTPERHRSLMKAGMGSVTISLDGTKTNHNWLRNNPKSFERAMTAIATIASEPRLTYDVVTCVNRKNIQQLEEVRNLLSETGVKAWRLFTIVPIGRAAGNDLMHLQPGELRQLMEFIQENREYRGMKLSFSCEGYVGPWEGVVRDGFFFCRAGIHIGSILADGSVSACPNIGRAAVQGNIYERDFADIWNTEFGIMRDRSWTEKGMCASCNHYKWCGGNGMHLWDMEKRELMHCHYRWLQA